MPRIWTSKPALLRGERIGILGMNICNEIVEQFRAAREAYAAQFDFDLAAIFEDLKKKQEHLERLAQLRPVLRKTPVPGVR